MLTIIHSLDPNKLYTKSFKSAHRTSISNPVIRGVTYEVSKSLTANKSDLHA